MTDPLRSDRPPSAAEVPERDRDARVEQLLLTGLDHYFAAQYQLAISVWTRVLFLNHGHARARAYMERARSAIAERQRESEELLHTGREAFTRGDAKAARRLLTTAIERGAAPEEALAMLDRLDRLEPVVRPAGRLTLAIEREAEVSAPVVATPREPAPSRLRWVAAGCAGGAIVVFAAGWLWFRGADVWGVQPTSPASGTVAPDAEPLPVPAASEASIARARTLQAKGHLQEALASLDSVRHGDARWYEADQLRAVIQRQLLSGAGSPVPAVASPGDQASRR